MNALESIEIIRSMYKGNPTSLQLKALDMAYAALEKQIPDSCPAQFDHDGSLECGGCGSDTDIENMYCPYCGQRLVD